MVLNAETSIVILRLEFLVMRAQSQFARNERVILRKRGTLGEGSKGHKGSMDNYGNNQLYG